MGNQRAAVRARHRPVPLSLVIKRTSAREGKADVRIAVLQRQLLTLVV